MLYHTLIGAVARSSELCVDSISEATVIGTVFDIFDLKFVCIGQQPPQQPHISLSTVV